MSNEEKKVCINCYFWSKPRAQCINPRSAFYQANTIPSNISGCGIFYKSRYGKSLDDLSDESVLDKKTEGKTKTEIATEIAELTEEKNEAYGDSCVFVTRVFELMYPDGIPVSAYQDSLVMVRVLDKLNRIAHRKDAFGESPWRDIMGYALMALDIEQRQREKGES